MPTSLKYFFGISTLLTAIAMVFVTTRYGTDDFKIIREKDANSYFVVGHKINTVDLKFDFEKIGKNYPVFWPEPECAGIFHGLNDSTLPKSYVAVSLPNCAATNIIGRGADTVFIFGVWKHGRIDSAIEFTVSAVINGGQHIIKNKKINLY